jgi:hypothetical protein
MPAPGVLWFMARPLSMKGASMPPAAARFQRLASRHYAREAFCARIPLGVSRKRCGTTFPSSEFPGEVSATSQSRDEFEPTRLTEARFRQRKDRSASCSKQIAASSSSRLRLAPAPWPPRKPSRLRPTDMPRAMMFPRRRTISKQFRESRVGKGAPTSAGQ